MTFLISHTCFSGFTYYDPLYRQRHKAHARVPRVATAHAALASAAAPSPKKLTARRPRTSRRHLAGHTMRPLGTRPMSSPRGSLEHHLCAVARAAWVSRDRLVGFVSAQPWPYGQVYRGRAYSPGNLHSRGDRMLVRNCGMAAPRSRPLQKMRPSSLTRSHKDGAGSQ